MRSRKLRISVTTVPASHAPGGQRLAWGINTHRAMSLFARRRLRSERAKNANLTLLQKLKLYNGKTLPGFTELSGYPKMIGEAGIPYPEMLDRLIACAFARHARSEARLFRRSG